MVLLAACARCSIRSSTQQLPSEAAMPVTPRTDDEWTVGKDLVALGVATAASHGLLALSGDADGASWKHVPFTLTPFKLSRAAFDTSKSYTAAFLKLVDRASRDLEFIHEAVDHVAAVDDFSKRLLHVLDESQRLGPVQKFAIGLIRSDYMVDQHNGQPLQIELNTISSSFGALSDSLSDVHRSLLMRLLPRPEVAAFMARRPAGPSDESGDSEAPPTRCCGSGAGEGAGAGCCGAASDPCCGADDFECVEGRACLPTNGAVANLAAGLAHAVKLTKLLKACMVCITVEGETNVVDQHRVEEAMWTNHGVATYRMTFAESVTQLKLDDSTKVLTVAKTGAPVGVVYYRSGYAPDHYKSDADWEARLRLETSSAIKCPSIGYHIVGMKKVQQRLAQPGVVEKFLSKAESRLVRESFAGLWNLDKKEEGSAGAVDAIVEAACKDPDRYVLKPQREGGGYNYYGTDVKTKLTELNDEERAAYILMQRIVPAEQQVVFVRNGRAEVGPGTAELGIFGVVIGNGHTQVRNCHAGHILRVKGRGVDEGGVASGFAVLSSPYLVD